MLGHRRPVGAAGPIAGVVVTLAAWAAIAHNSGSGWVQALGALLAGVLLVGLVGPALAVGRARVALVASPGDATVGGEVDVELSAAGRIRVRPLEPPGPVGFVGPGPSRPADTVQLRPERHGVHDSLLLEIASAAPFGLLWWARPVRVALPVPLHVAPRPGQPLALPPSADDGTGARRLRQSLVAGEPRGVRPYRPGDSRRRVHWPATAHAGALMVRELESPGSDPVVVRVELPTDVDAAEVVCGQGLATVISLLDRGVPVVLDTLEATGRRVGSVGDHHDARRRLARAVAPAETAPPTRVVSGVTVLDGAAVEPGAGPAAGPGAEIGAGPSGGRRSSR